MKKFIFIIKTFEMTINPIIKWFFNYYQKEAETSWKQFLTTAVFNAFSGIFKLN